MSDQELSAVDKYVARREAEREAEEKLRRPLRWEAIEKKVNEIAAESIKEGWNHGSSRSQGLVGHDSTVCHFKIFTSDGRVKLHVVTAFHGFIGQVKVSVDVFWSDNDPIWQDRLDKLRDRNLIVNHKFYSIGLEERDVKGVLQPGGGFGGALVRFQRINWVGTPGEPGAYRYYSGKVMATRNLWFGGVIPPAWRDRLPDNAVFLDSFDGPTVNS